MVAAAALAGRVVELEAVRSALASQVSALRADVADAFWTTQRSKDVYGAVAAWTTSSAAKVPEYVMAWGVLITRALDPR